MWARIANPRYPTRENLFISAPSGLSSNVVDASIEIRKNHKTRLPDAIIAATALVYDLVVISRNVSDFKNIKGIQVIDPHSL